MKLSNSNLILAPTDFSKHLSCKFLTAQNLHALETGVKPPFISSPVLQTLQELGNQHEKDYLEYLRGAGKSVAEPADNQPADWVDNAIADGTDVIYHARLSNDRWSGEADFLIRRSEGQQIFYEAYDTKLARKTRAQTLLQLYVYSLILKERVSVLKVSEPENMYVVTPADKFTVETYRIADYAAYLRYLDADFADFLDNPTTVYPEAIPFCDFCNYWSECNQKRRDDDYLGFVAGITTSQRTTLAEVGIDTLEQLATAKNLPKLPTGSYISLRAARKQAELQLRGREGGISVYEVKPSNGDEPHGLSMLPEPTPDDIFLDFEGDHFAQEGTVVEYLTGYLTTYDDSYDYQPLWATTPAEEKNAFESFIDFAVDTYQRNPDAHIYHFAPYEQSALKRLMIKYSTREIELDLLLSNQVFVDLHRVVKQSLVASVEKYSLKDLEVFLDFQREQDLKEASQSRRVVESALNNSFYVAPELFRQHKQAVEDYNREDCLATYHLQQWLEIVRTDAIANGLQIPRPARVEEAEQRERAVDLEIADIRRRLLRRLPADLVPTNDEERAILLLSNLVGYYRREQKASAWEYFRLMELPADDYFNEPRALSGLTFQQTIIEDEKPTVRFTYPPQEVVLKTEDAMRLPGVKSNFGYVRDVNFTDRTIDIQIYAEHSGYPNHLNSPEKYFATKKHQESLFALATQVADDGLENLTTQPLAKSLLLRAPPHSDISHAHQQADNESTLEAAVRISRKLDSDVLAIQGPPGTGKTYTGANVILDLLASGKRVGVTAVSHKAIDAILNKVAELAEEQGRDVICYKKGKPKEDYDGPLVIADSHIGTYRAGLKKDIHLLGGTLWLWCHDWFRKSVDVLVVDEAGQMSLANVLAASRCADSLILLGDPQQLEQPAKSSHPDGADIAALEYFSGSGKTMPPEQGLFLGETRRLHPEICRFTSVAFYDGRLSTYPKPAGELHRRVESNGRLQGAGLRFVAVEHYGNQSSSAEEAAAVAELIAELEQSSLSPESTGEQSRTIAPEDILIITPFNAQITLLTGRLPSYANRIGTVDRFQGQEAAIVIYSMASSSAEDAPRGMGFLYDPNRLNVATSRAEVLCVLVAAPELFRPECSTTEQMALANGLCTYREMAVEV